MRRVAAIALCLLLGTAGSLRAQLDFVADLFGKGTDLSAYAIFGNLVDESAFATDSSDGLSLDGIGIEVLIDLGTIWQQKDKACPDEVVTSELKEVRVHRRKGVVTDSTEVREVSEDFPKGTSRRCKSLPSIGAELGFGYSQVTGIKGSTASFRTGFEELPAVSLYITYHHWFVRPYVGIRGGLTQLKDSRAFVQDTILKASGSTFEYGAVAGLAFSPPESGWALFADLAYTYRRFDGISWEGEATVPEALRAPLGLRTVTLSIGGQIEFGGKDAE